MEKDSIDNLLSIFTIAKMKELKKHCRDTSIQQRDFANFIMACKSGHMPWHHAPTHRTFTPDHLPPTEEDLSALHSNGVGPLKPDAKKTVSKVFALIDERRVLSGHMFFSEDFSDWHFFYFDQRDRARRGNHWHGGPHIHILNRLWPNRSAASVWDEFNSGNPQMRGALHIRFSDDIA